MNTKFAISFFFFATLSGCSGFTPVSFFSEGKIVSSEYLAKYEGGGSLSSLWYLGSDNEFHYFAHYVKTSTKYRILRKELSWANEYPYTSNSKPTLVNGELKAHVNKNS